MNGRFQRGFATLPEAVTKKLKATGYRFHDTTKADALTGEDLTAIPQPKVDSPPVAPKRYKNRALSPFILFKLIMNGDFKL